jgi:hypothetical protein
MVYQIPTALSPIQSSRPAVRRPAVRPANKTATKQPATKQSAKAQPAKPFEILEHLGSGTFGQVKKIKRTSDGKVGALRSNRTRLLTRLEIIAMKIVDLRKLEPKERKAVDEEQ